MRCKVCRVLAKILIFSFSVSIIKGTEFNDHIHFPGSYKTSKVLFELRPPPAVRPQSFVGCYRPLESDTFTNCSADGRKYPAYSASCECRNCHLKLALTCQNDGNWYANAGVDVCNKNSHRRCGHCGVDAVPTTVKCFKNKDGHTGEKRTCLCRKNCIGISLMCDKSKLWKNDYLKACEMGVIGQSFLKDANMFKQYNDGKYLYTCRNGFKMTGPNVVTCVDGQLSSHRPECVPEVPEDPVHEVITEKPTTETAETSTVSTTTVHHKDNATAELLQEITTEVSDTSNLPTTDEIEEDQDMSSDYLASQNKLPPKKKFPITMILIIVFVLLILILTIIILYKLSKHYVLVVQFGNKTFATKPGYTNDKSNECTNEGNDGIQLRVKS